MLQTPRWRAALHGRYKGKIMPLLTTSGVIGNRHGIKGNGMPYVSLIEKASKKYRIPEVLISHQISQESSFDPYAVSPAGAVGLMQLMPATAAETAARYNLPGAPLTDPVVNVNLGMAYLYDRYKQAWKYIKDPEQAFRLALVGYFAGPSRIKQIAVDRSPLTRAERAYVGGTPEFPVGVIWDFEKTENWNQLKPPGGSYGASPFPWWLLLLVGGYYVYKKR